MGIQMANSGVRDKYRASFSQICSLLFPGWDNEYSGFCYIFIYTYSNAQNSSLKGQGTEKKRYKLFSFVLPPFFVSLCMINTVLNSKVKLPLSPPVSPTHFHVPKTGKYCCFFQYANQINCVCKFLFFFPKRSGYIIDIMF